MSQNPKFQEFLAFGEALEQASQQHLFPKLFPFCDAYRIGSEKVWRSFGADYLLLDNHRNRALLVEVKADTKTTGNLVVETYSISANTAQRTYGWFHTSKADYVVYISIPQRRILILDLPKLRGMLQERKFPLRSTQLNVGYTAYFYLIPWDWALVEFPSITIPEEEWSLWEETIQEHLQKEPM